MTHALGAALQYGIIRNGAAYELGRNSYGFEVDKKFYDSAKKQMLAPLFEDKMQMEIEL